MRKSRVLLAGVAVAAAGVATSAFTASNTLRHGQRRRFRHRSPSPVPSSPTSTTSPLATDTQYVDADRCSRRPPTSRARRPA